MPTDQPTKPKRGVTPQRHFRIPDRIFHAAAERAEREGVYLSDVVREKLRDYAEGR